MKTTLRNFCYFSKNRFFYKGKAQNDDFLARLSVGFNCWHAHLYIA